MYITFLTTTVYLSFKNEVISNVILYSLSTFAIQFIRLIKHIANDNVNQFSSVLSDTTVCNL